MTLQTKNLLKKNKKKKEEGLSHLQGDSGFTTDLPKL